MAKDHTFSQFVFRNPSLLMCHYRSAGPVFEFSLSPLRIECRLMLITVDWCWSQDVHFLIHKKLIFSGAFPLISFFASFVYLKGSFIGFPLMHLSFGKYKGNLYAIYMQLTISGVQTFWFGSLLS